MANRNVEIIQEIISELNALQNSKDPPDTRQDGPIPFPRLLSGKNNAQILVNKRIELLIQDLGRKTYNDALKVNHIATLKEWQRAIRSFFGVELTGAIDLTNEQVAAKTIRKNCSLTESRKLKMHNKLSGPFLVLFFLRLNSILSRLVPCALKRAKIG